MATTQESLIDGLVWVGKIARIGLRRGVIILMCALAFAVLVAVQTRDRVSDCGAITTEQETRIENLPLETSAEFSLVDSPACVDGLLSAPVEGSSTELAVITEELVERGWTHETTYIAYDLQVTRHCFGFAEPGWNSIQLLAESDRGGHNATLTISALEGEPSCESERREESVIFPPRQSG